MHYLVLASLLWSFSFGLIKTQTADLDPYLVSLIRLGLSALLFLPFLKPLPPRRGFLLAGIGMVQFGLMYCLYIYSYQFLLAHQVALLTVTTPIFVVWLDAGLTRRWVWRYWGAALLVVIAALTLVWKEGGLTGPVQGLLLIQGANLCFALGQVCYKRYGGSGGDRERFGWLYLGALAVPFLFLVLSRDLSLVAWPQRGLQWASLLYLGLVPAGLGFFLWNKGVVAVNAGAAAVMNNLKLPLGVLLAWALFGEQIDGSRFLPAAGLFLLALYWCRFGAPEAGRPESPFQIKPNPATQGARGVWKQEK